MSVLTWLLARITFVPTLHWDACLALVIWLDGVMQDGFAPIQMRHCVYSDSLRTLAVRIPFPDICVHSCHWLASLQS